MPVERSQRSGRQEEKEGAHLGMPHLRAIHESQRQAPSRGRECLRGRTHSGRPLTVDRSLLTMMREMAQS